MRKMKESNKSELPKYLSIEMLSWYLSVGRNTALRVGSESGAKRKIGRRVLFDRDEIDKYLAQQEV